jgi:hypothetical protein
MLLQGPQGRCRSCGIQLVDWSRVHKRDVGDAKYTFEALRLELIRHHFWHVPFSSYAVNYARRKGRAALQVATKHQIRKRIGAAQNFREGYQTPRETSPTANAIDYAQHATASCCRHCAAEWHGIPEGRALTDDEVSYLSALAVLYIQDRLPDLKEEPLAVPKGHPKPTGQSLTETESRSEELHVR